ncbi:LOW QUALITY PROTEIN: usherin-like [Dendronephthya gigantea]|uniref:LOW QUALITY PROTEIN: usherin-like n=1 Tax=Dendronephthya gigantea TaxID=151771 RepID=UPI00106A2081|nr:LOW QUALITY PROTEIN: usherin-like [Dendronephthya gigantea]
MGRIAHLLVLSLLFFCGFSRVNGYFLQLKDFARNSEIKASSTCGETETRYCDPKEIPKGCTKFKICKSGCCPTCGKAPPNGFSLTDDERRYSNIYDGQPRPGSNKNSLGFDARKGSYIDIARLRPVDHKKKGFTICLWVNQTLGNKGTIFTKSPLISTSVIYGIVLENFIITLYYTPEGSNNTQDIKSVSPLASQYPNDPQGWHFICVMVIDTKLSYFLDGEYVGMKTLRNNIADVNGRAQIGQMFASDKPNNYSGLMQDIYFYNKALTNREVTEVYTGTFPSTYILSGCRCPPMHPKISSALPGRKCAKNGDKTQTDLADRLADTAHPIEFATDGDSLSHWLSQDTEQVTIDVDLMYGELQVFHVIHEFYGPIPAAIILERSNDYGRSYRPWQYYAVDCQKSFGMLNNGPLGQPDSVNCLRTPSLENTGETISFRPNNPGAKNVPLRPYGGSCTSLHCSPKLLNFLRATNVRISFYNHTMFSDSMKKYFGLSKLVITGRCECHGNAEVARYLPKNETNNGTCVCECKPSTFTEGDKCDRCQALYNNKPFKRGTNFAAYPCVKCECHNHATSCYYNQASDPFPNDRAKGGGGVCSECQHNTVGKNCESCTAGFYREPGKALNDTDVCTPCGCAGPGVKSGKQDCVKDDSDTTVLAGQCECKDNVTGRLCTQCKPGYYDLKSTHDTGCISCNCDVRGTVDGDVTCDAASGQCRCKANVIGQRCDQCKAMFYNLTRVNSEGCQPCLCNMSGSTSRLCDKTNGQCPCRNTVTGRQCERCKLGFHTLTTSGCQSCHCSERGTRFGAAKRCDVVSGQCQCKNYVTGYTCDRCKPGHYNLRQSNGNGCTRCQCDNRGTLGVCHNITGVCTCKRNVTGQFCDQCPRGYYNLTSSNPNGCQACECYRKGTQDGTKNSDLQCSSTSGQCLCLSNVRGLKCDQCDTNYVWNQAGQGCVACRCHLQGSASTTCNATGFCTCKNGTGVGGQFCDECLTGYHSFTSGSCTSCDCNKAGIKKDGCDRAGCYHCKENVQGTRCDTCKPGTRSLKEENTFGCSGVPSQQGPPFVHVISSTTLRVLWDPPDKPNGLITSYELYRNGSRVYTGLLREFNDTRLRPYTWYSYHIVTNTDGGSVRSYDDGKLYRTKEDVPQGVSRPNISDIQPRSAKAVWSYPTTSNGKLTSFFLESTNHRDFNTIEHCRGLVLKCDVINLRPFTVYNFTIRVCTSVGCTVSEAKTVLTSQTAPDSQPAPNLVPLPGGTSFVVSWDEPAEPNGRIFQYELLKRLFPSHPDNRGKVAYRSHPLENPGADNLRNTTIRGLIPFTWYEFQVVSYTAQVAGDTASNWTRGRTAEAAPSGESAIRPQSYAVSSSKINITWHLPSSPRGIIITSRVYIYTNETAYSTPVLEQTANLTSSVVVSGLQPYTVYKFTVTSCNSVGCTKHSAETRTRTLPSAPSGQSPPTGEPLNSTHVVLRWKLPTNPNGPVPPEYHLTRSHASFYYPPINAIKGAYFPGHGYYLLSQSTIPEGPSTVVDFWFKTGFSDGLIIFLASVTQDDFLAVEIRDGRPWLIFDLGVGSAETTVKNSPKFNDKKWHFVAITRSRRVGEITVDSVFVGRVESPTGASYLGKNTGVYIGGLKSGLTLKKKILDNVDSLKNSNNFIGCLKDLRQQKKRVILDNAVEKVSVEPLSSGCPKDHETGFYLKGGGYLSLRKGLFTGGNIYKFSFEFRTVYTSGMLMFVYGEKSGNDTYLTVSLDSGDIRVIYQTSCCYGNITIVPLQEVCDGGWHTLEFINFAGIYSIIEVDGKTNTTINIAKLRVTSELYFGGLPFGSLAAQKAGSFGLNTDSTFGGCFRNIKTPNEVDILRDVASVMNVDLGGCPTRRRVNSSFAEGCKNETSNLVYVGSEESLVDGQLSSFTDYLYRVESKQPGTEGGGASSWFVLRSGEGAPEFYRPPSDVIPLNGGRSTRVTWQPPQVYRGVLRGYILRAYHVRNSSVRPVEMVLNDISVVNATLSGLEPYTWYDVRVAAFTNGGTGESPGKEVRTLESVPQGVQSPDVQRYPHSLLISWGVPRKPNGVINQYRLTINNTEVYGGLNQTFNQTGLGVYTRHVIQMTACTKIGCASSEPETFYTAEIPPQGLSPPGVRILGAHRAEVTWKEPGIRNGIIRGYQILVTGGHSWETLVLNGTADQRLIEITNLTAGTWYSFRLKAINGGGATISLPTRRRTVESSPEDIPPPLVRGLSPYSILVTILEPRLPNGNITRYELHEVIGRDEVPVLNETSIMNYTKDGLTPYTRYYFRTTACTAKGCGSSVVGNGTTLEATPNGTVSLNVTIVNSTSARAQWSPVHTPNGIVYYNLVVSGEFLIHGTFTTENDTRVVARVVHPLQEMLFTELLPFTSFVFQINASNSAGYILSNIVQGRTGQGAPLGLTAPNVTVLNSTSVEITWLPPARKNGILLFYEIMRHNLDSGVRKIVNASIQFSLVMTDMKPYLMYGFQLGASTMGGKTWSDVTEVRTFQDVPTPLDPPTIPQINSRDLVVTWDEASEPNGIIIHYILYRNNTNRTKVANNVTRLRVTGLEPFTVYVFSVAACTVIGCSNSSLSRPVRTLEDVPEGQSSPVLTHASGPYVIIRWSEPTVTNGKISEYIIERRSALDLLDVSSVARVSANLSREHLDNTVVPCLKYYYRVIAFTKAGGTPSSWSNITTQEGAPEFVPRPTTRSLNSTAVHVTWSKARSQCIIIHYIVRILENNRNYSKIEASDPLNIIISGLLPYKVYNIVVVACTGTACRESDPSDVRTQTGLPSDQPAPSARALSSTSLRVTWEPPSVPGGRIQEFILYRRTLSEPLSENFTMTSYVKIHSGVLPRSFDDKGLGIFSKQQYKVTVVNTHGNTTSEDSPPYRTGPVPPRAGVLLSGQALNHTSVLLNWTLPEVKLLLGYVRSYEIRYKDIEADLEFTFTNNLPGSARNVVVTPLTPSKDYSFQVVLDNGAGTKSSNEVIVRTQDGAPEGFDRPNVRTINSTAIEVTWSSPRTPNGRITTYHIYANSQRVGSTLALYFNITSLIPFTNYAIQVEVCTVYTCVRSLSSNTRTLPAVPEFLDSPILFPGRRNILVTWDPPRRPNGVIREYILYRQTPSVCPTKPPPVRLCTYIECPISEELCGTSCYSPKTKICCQGVLYDKEPGKMCCDDKYVKKQSSSDVCCGGRFYAQTTDYQCCHGSYKLVKSGQVCCQDNRGSIRVGDGNACCDGEPYFNNTKYCVCGTLFNDNTRKCCGGKIVALVQKCCGGPDSGVVYTEDRGKKCCGNHYVPMSSLCCQSNTGSWKIYNYTSVRQRQDSGDVCCGMNRISTGLSCCNDQGFNASTQVCADKEECGNGTVCDKTSRNTASCNRCNFNVLTSHCGLTKGYYTSTPPTPPPQDCGTFTQVISGNSTLRHYNDQNLEPYTDYEYYVVVFNTEGNLSSPYSSNKTLMDSPEGLVPPTVIVRTARSIEVLFTPPKKPNGIISEYKLTRGNLNSTVRTLVYRGLELSFLDSNVSPVTGYFYIFEACTTLCSNITSKAIYTRESTPENVYPPILKALSAYSIEISWQTPGRPNGVITGYNISRVNNSGDIVRQWRGYNMVHIDNSSDLRPFTNYTYVITACTKVGCSDGPRGFVMTLEAAPETVQRPELQVRSSKEIEINWEEPAVSNGEIIWYTLYRDNISICNTSRECKFSTPSTGKYRYSDKGLKPHTTYSYIIEASTQAGATKSDVARRQTPQDSPELIPSPTLTPQTSASILVTWTAPGNPNGVIKNYTVIQDTVIEHPAGDSLKYLVSGLKPFTNYNFQIRACTRVGCGIGNRSMSRTLEAAPSGQPPPSLVAQSDEVVLVKWRGPRTPNGIILSYEIERRLASSTYSLVFRTTKPFVWQLQDSRLLPYRNYSYRVRAINSGGSVRSAWATVRTGEGAPSGVYSPVIHVLNSTAVAASWKEPREPNGIITLYELYAQDIGSSRNKFLVASSSLTEKNVTVSGLNPNTDYQFQLAVSTVGGTGYSGWKLAETLEAPPLDLRPLIASKDSDGKGLKFTWQEPSQPNGAITDYIVYSNGVKEYSGTKREFHLPGLTPFTSYTFQLEACTSAGCTKGSIQVVTTAEIPPDLLQAPEFTSVNSTYVTLKWQPPVRPNGIIVLYQVFRTDTKFAVYNTSNINITSYTDSQVQPYTKYGYTIRAINSAGKTDSRVAFITTNQAAPELVHPPVIIAVTSTSVEMSWAPPGKLNGVVRSYTLRRNNTVVNHWGFTILKYTDSSVKPNIIYGYWLTVCTEGGCSDSDKTIVRSGEGQPGAVRAPKLTVLSAIAIRASWQPPIISNGVVIRYELYMDNSLEYNGTRMSYIKSELQPFSLHKFHVVACTKSGCTEGPWNEARTHEAAPESLAAPTYTIFGPNVIEIRWTEPRKPNGVILYYTLQRNGTLVYNGSRLRYIDQNIEPYTYYSYQVNAFNLVGHVSSPVLHTERTSHGTPENVTKPNVTPLSGTEIRVTWSAPLKPNGIIKVYFVLYNNFPAVNVGSNMSYIARNLKYFTDYTFRIRACTSYPSSCADGDVASTKTLEGVPSGQLAPVLPDTTVQARSVMVTWNEPKSPNGKTLRYLVYRSQDNGNTSAEIFRGLGFKFNDTTTLPYKKYGYRVTAVNSVGLVTSDWTSVTTRSDLPEQVSTPRILAVTETTLVVAFDPPGIPNGVIVNYIVRLNDKPVSEGTHLERTIRNLEPFVEYSLQVYACTIVGCTGGQAIAGKTGAGKPNTVEEPTFGEVTANSIEVKWRPPLKPNGDVKRYSVLYKFICSDNCISKRSVSQTAIDVGLNTTYAIIDLEPYSMYEIVIRVFNEKYSADSAPVRRRTGPSAPEYIRLPEANQTGNVVIVDWSKSFKLNGPLFEYNLYENDFLIFRGTSSNSGHLTGRVGEEYIYVVSATTTVNGEKKTIKSPPFNVKGVPVTDHQSQDDDNIWYETVWFLVLIAVLLILVVFSVVALCLRRTSGDRTVFVRERDPLPVRVKSRSAAASLSSNYTPSEAHFNLALVDPQDRGSRASTFIGGSEKMRYEQEDSIDWEGYEGNVYSGRYDDEKTWSDDDEVDAFRSMKYQPFTDTRL